MILQICTLLGAIGLFLFGIAMMSSGVQKVTGDRLRKTFLPWMTSNPLKRILSGLGITAIIQSSSATTVMVVSFVNAGLLSLAQAVGVIMGANIGTTITAWIVSLLGFRFSLQHLIFPLMLVGFICSMTKKTKAKEIAEFIIGFSIVFLGLFYMQAGIPAIADHQGAFNSLSMLCSHGFWSVLIFIIIGIAITVIFQSSGATVAVTMIFMNVGWLPFDMSAAIVLGANIGTTITANVAAAIADANIQARRAALIHTLINLIGVFTWCIILFHPFLNLVGKIISLFSDTDPSVVAYSSAALSGSVSSASLCGIALVHTMFNLINAFILIWFTNVIVKIVTWFVKDPEPNQANEFTLKYISAGRLATPSLSLDQAFKELVNFASTAKEGCKFIKPAIEENNPDQFEVYRSKLVECEEVTDKFEYEIANFLSGITTGEISSEEAEEVKVIYRVIGELESIGDCCENISRILSRLRAHNQEFDKDTIDKLIVMDGKVNDAFDVMIDNLKLAENDGLTSIDNAYECERAINNSRNNLRDDGVKAIENQADNYQAMNYFLDLIQELEAMGDFMINVSQAIVKNA